MSGLSGPDLPALEMGCVVSGRAGDDAVVVLREALSLGERLPAARGAAVEIGTLRGASVVGSRDGFSCAGHFKHRTLGEVLHLFGVAGNECRAVAGVPGIGAGGGVSRGNGSRHRAIADGTGPRAITDRLEFSVPAGSRQPDFDLDLGVLHRPECGRNPAECGQAFKGRSARGPHRRRWRELAGRHGLRQRNRGMRY